METDAPTEALVPGGTALADFLYPAPAERNAGAIIGWWERRRLPFNFIVAGSGALSIGFVVAVTAIPPGGGWIGIPWAGMAVYALLANVCYSLGPAVEIGLEKLWGRRILPSGPFLFRAGLTLSVGLSLLPIIVVTIGYVFRILEVLI